MDMQAIIEAVHLEAEPHYTEWVGELNRTVNGGKQLTGVVSLEIFKLTA
jgi:hypothetical protein